jgi:protein O-GlcNAc transferase
MSLDAALALQRRGEFAAAEEVCRSHLTQQPLDADALHLLGILALLSGRPQAAVEPISRSLESNPQQPVAHMNLGVALQHLNERERALGCFDGALRLAPDYAEALNNRGNVLLELQRPQAAVESLERALHFRPDFPLAWYNHGNALRSLGRLDEALISYERALRLDPTLAPALCNHSALLLEFGRPDQALLGYQRLLQLHPLYPDGLYGAAMSLLMLKRFQEASSYLATLCDREPRHPYALGYRLNAARMICDWDHYTQRARAELVAAVTEGLVADTPFSFLSVSDSAAAQLRCASTFTADRYPATGELRPRRSPHRHARIHLAYVSGDLRDHAVARVLAGVFEQHDRGRFEITAIALRSPTSGAFGQRINTAFDRFIDVSARSDAAVVALMQELEIDIGIDLAGYTDGQRGGIFAARGASVQVNYLGYPGSMGAPHIDYIVADQFLIPPRSRVHYAESVTYLPECFQPADDRRARPGGVDRAQFGLPRDALVCCSLNNIYKYNETMFDVWCRVLTQVPGSVLWLLAYDADTEANLRRACERRGLPAGRLVLSPRVSYENHLARLSCADLFLDTVPFNAGATAGDALWLGVPLLTCAGEAFAARMAGSLLRTAGLSELITFSLEDYERRALELLRAPGQLKELRSKIAVGGKLRAPFDTQRYCRQLETAFQIMHERALRGEPPSDIVIQP